MAETNTIKGVVYKIMHTQQISEKFAKKEIVIKTDGEYPQFVPIQFINKNIDKLDNITTGSIVVISYNLKGNEYKEKFYVSIDGWKIQIENQQFNSSQKREDVAHYENEMAKSENMEGANYNDDLPF